MASYIEHSQSPLTGVLPAASDHVQYVRIKSSILLQYNQLNLINSLVNLLSYYSAALISLSNHQFL